MSGLRTVRGTRDLLPEDSRRLRQIEEKACETARRYGYGEIATPIFEFTEVFARTLGDTSDVVTKEMYTFEDRGGDSLTLRQRTPPASSAPSSPTTSRASAAPRLLPRADVPLRAAAEGRLRQFHQVGVELLGVADPLADVEVIKLAVDFLTELGLGESFKIEINTLGDPESRANYRARLVEYLEGQPERLSADSLDRLERNPLRILDSKDPTDREVVAGAPKLAEALNERSREFFAAVLRGLMNAHIGYEVNPRLVRGLDYYCHTTFEFVTESWALKERFSPAVGTMA